MKLSNYILIVVLISLAKISSGQIKPIDIEFQIGPSISYLIHSFDSEYEYPKINPAIAFSFHLSINEKASIVLIPSIVNKGARDYHPSIEYNDSVYSSFFSSVNLLYVTTPLLWRRYIGERQNFYIDGGPYLAIKIRDKFKSYNRLLGRTFVYSYTAEDSNYKRLDAGISCGLGFNKELSNILALTLSLRYNCGLINVLVFNHNKAFNNSIDLLLGIRFNRGK